MTCWNPHELLSIGQEKGYDEEYLAKLVDNGELINEKSAPVLYSLAHLAHCSRTLYSDLHDFVSRKEYSNSFPYKHFPIKKRTGGTRWISVPVPPLWAVQSWIVKNILQDITPHRCSTAYSKGCSPKQNANKHCIGAWLLKLDIEDFFGNISERQVFHVFRSLGYVPLLSFEMARLCTKISKHNEGKRWNTGNKWFEINGYYSHRVGCLPQGAPTSPMLSNLVSRTMDEELYQLSKQCRGNYTRYADDLTFSFYSTSRDNLINFKEEVIKVVRKNGFKINSVKTKIVSPGARKIVTGLVCNDREPRLKSEYKDNIRAHLYYCNKYGVANHCKKRGFRSILGFKNHLTGLINYACSVESGLKEKYYPLLNSIDWGHFEL